MRSDVLDQVLDVASAIFGIPRKALKPQSTPEDIESWDSVRHLTLMLALEQQFGITIPPEDTDDMGTLEMIADVVERILASHDTPPPRAR
jgi:acyl carrier protein